MNKLAIILATGLGLGYSPVASGTAGSYLGVVIVIAMEGLPSLFWQIVVAIALAAVAVPICGVAEEHFRKKDDGRIVADEYLTFPICMLGLPWIAQPWILAVGFVTNRILDIIKPPPARQSQRLTGGLGIVMDDVFSSLYSLALNHAIFWAVSRFATS